MADALLDFLGDGANSDTVLSYVQILTAGYSGSYSDYTCPASPNFPPTGKDSSGNPVSPSRYITKLNFTPFVNGSLPMLVKDVTSATTLTLVSGAPSINQYRWWYNTNNNTICPDVLEFNSGQAGHTIAISCYAKQSIIHADQYNNPKFSGNVAVSGNETISGTLGVTGNTILSGTLSSGQITANVTGNLTGNSNGTHTGAVIGNVTGNCSGSAGSTQGLLQYLPNDGADGIFRNDVLSKNTLTNGNSITLNYYFFDSTFQFPVIVHLSVIFKMSTANDPFSKVKIWDFTVYGYTNSARTSLYGIWNDNVIDSEALGITRTVSAALGVLTVQFTNSSGGTVLYGYNEHRVVVGRLQSGYIG